jgi:hypothetical protein
MKGMAAKKGKSSRKPKGLTAAEQARYFAKLKEEIEKERRKVKEGDSFTAPTDDQLKQKLKRTNTPFIYFQGWTSAVAPGGTISYNVGITNPDPITQTSMFAHVFVGPANVVAAVGDALQIVDTRFPRLTEPKFFGLSIASGASATLTFSIKVPLGIDPSNYLGNTFLFQFNWHDVGTYFDRSVFVFQVT